jgi:hypothetical protein
VAGLLPIARTGKHQRQEQRENQGQPEPRRAPAFNQEICEGRHLLGCRLERALSGDPFGDTTRNAHGAQGSDEGLQTQPGDQEPIGEARQGARAEAQAHGRGEGQPGAQCRREGHAGERDLAAHGQVDAAAGDHEGHAQGR